MHNKSRSEAERNGFGAAQPRSRGESKGGRRAELSRRICVALPLCVSGEQSIAAYLWESAFGEDNEQASFTAGCGKRRRRRDNVRTGLKAKGAANRDIPPSPTITSFLLNAGSEDMLLWVLIETWVGQSSEDGWVAKRPC